MVIIDVLSKVPAGISPPPTILPAIPVDPALPLDLPGGGPTSGMEALIPLAGASDMKQVEALLRFRGPLDDTMPPTFPGGLGGSEIPVHESPNPAAMRGASQRGGGGGGSASDRHIASMRNIEGEMGSVEGGVDTPEHEREERVVQQARLRAALLQDATDAMLVLSEREGRFREPGGFGPGRILDLGGEPSLRLESPPGSAGMGKESGSDHGDGSVTPSSAVSSSRRSSESKSESKEAVGRDAPGNLRRNSVESSHGMLRDSLVSTASAMSDSLADSGGVGGKPASRGWAGQGEVEDPLQHHARLFIEEEEFRIAQRREESREKETAKRWLSGECHCYPDPSQLREELRDLLHLARLTSTARAPLFLLNLDKEGSGSWTGRAEERVRWDFLAGLVHKLRTLQVTLLCVEPKSFPSENLEGSAGSGARDDASAVLLRLEQGVHEWGKDAADPISPTMPHQPPPPPGSEQQVSGGSPVEELPYCY